MGSALDNDLTYHESTRRFAIPLGPDRVALYLTIVMVSVLVAAILIGTAGNVAAATAVVLALAIVFVSFFRIDLAFYVFIGMVLLFDQFIVVPSGDPITYSVGYFDNLKQMPFLPAISAGVMNPLEIQLALMLFGWFLSVCVMGTVHVQKVPLWGLALLFLVALVLSLVHGLSSGGDFLPALWEVRALFYFLLLYFLVPQVIQTKEQLNVLLWIFIIMIAIKDLQGAARFAALGFHFNGNPCLTNHEDPVFTTDLLILLIGFAVFRVKTRQKIAMLILLAPLLLGFYAGQRRSAYGGFLVCIIVLLVLLSGRERFSFMRVLVPLLLFAVCYSIVFWNSDGRLALPVQLIKSGIFESKEDDGSHYSSNLYREVERYDLAVTVQGSPVTGTGFGTKYLQPLPLVPIPFPLRDWIPHDEILWLIVKMGGLGFFIFWLFLDGILFETARLSRTLRDPFLKAVSLMIAAAIVNQMVVSYYDLQLTFYRNMVFLGTVCGLLPTLKAVDSRLGTLPSPSPGQPRAHRVYPLHVDVAEMTGQTS